MGGPRDGSSQDADGRALVEIEIDGMVAPGGGEPGVEDPAARVASPKADEQR